MDCLLGYLRCVFLFGYRLMARSKICHAGIIAGVMSYRDYSGLAVVTMAVELRWYWLYWVYERQGTLQQSKNTPRKTCAASSGNFWYLLCNREDDSSIIDGAGDQPVILQ